MGWKEVKGGLWRAQPSPGSNRGLGVPAASHLSRGGGVGTFSMSLSNNLLNYKLGLIRATPAGSRGNE